MRLKKQKEERKIELKKTITVLKNPVRGFKSKCDGTEEMALYSSSMEMKYKEDPTKWIEKEV